jgi:hypothetical protein
LDSSKSDVSEDEYKEFYKHISHDWNEPLETVSAKLEGNFEAQALLFIPSKAPFDLYSRDMAHKGIQLYVKRVFIMDDCKGTHAGVFALRSRCGGCRRFVAERLARDFATGPADQSHQKFSGQENSGNAEGNA